MNKIFILTEKRTAGIELAYALENAFNKDYSILEKQSKQQGFLEDDKYIISWAAGHLFRQCSPSEIKPEYGLYQHLENDEDYRMPNLRYEVEKKSDDAPYSIKQIKILKSQLNRKEINTFIIATDADAEGQSIAMDCLEQLTNINNRKVLRFWNTGSYKSKEAVKKAMDTLLSNEDPKYVYLHQSQIARQMCDYLTGLKTTKAAVDFYNKPFYLGRVKGVIIGLIGNRENEINNYQSSNYWTLLANKDELLFKHFFYEKNEDGNAIKSSQYFNKNEIQNVIDNVSEVDNKVEVESFTNNEIQTKTRPLPLSGSGFASDMMGQFPIEYESCNDILDYLRDEGFTSYPGTNGVWFSTDDSEDVKAALVTATNYFDTPAEFNKHAYLFNNKKAEKQNHAPLHPTNKIPTASDVEKWNKSKTPFIKEGYELIVKRILVSFLPDDLLIKQKLIVKSLKYGHLFEITGQRAMEQGWRSLVNKEINDSTFNPGEELKQGMVLYFDDLQVKESETKPPSLYTEKTLLDTLLNVSGVIDKMLKETDDPKQRDKYKKIKKLLKGAGGIGTDRTRATIINSLFENNMIELNKTKQITLSAQGWDMFKIYPPALKSIVLTAKWENTLEEIRRGETDYLKFINEVDNEVMDSMVSDIINNVGVDVLPNIKMREILEHVKCPLCNNTVIETNLFYSCETRKYDGEKSTGCSFSISKNQSKTLGRKLEGETDIKMILESKKEQPIQENKHSIYFNQESKSFIGVIWDEDVNFNELVETKKTFRMFGKHVYKNFRGRNITQNQALQLLQGKKIKIKRKSRAGKDYTVNAFLDDKTGFIDSEFNKSRKKRKPQYNEDWD